MYHKLLSYDMFPGLNVLVAYSDADFAGDLDTSQSTTGYLVLMNNGPFVWKSESNQVLL